MSDTLSPPSIGVSLAEGVTASDISLQHLSAALAAAQGDYTPSLKTATNTYGGYRYTPWVMIVAATRPALAAHHLLLHHLVTSDVERKTVTVTARLVHHQSGEWLQHALELPAEMAIGKSGAIIYDQRTIGGTITYATKYTTKSILGAPDAEDEILDGEEGERNNLPPRAAKKSKVEVETLKAPAANRTAIFSVATQQGWSLADVRALCQERYQTDTTARLTADQIEDFIAYLTTSQPPVIASIPAESADA